MDAIYVRILMLKTNEDEDEIVRWAFAETINYLKQSHDHFWFKYNPKHERVHKILYNFFEKMDIPVTRSWYRYGCFIHSTQLAGFQDFSSLKNRYLASRSSPERLRSHAEDLGIDVKSALIEMHRIIDVIPSRMDLYLESLYQDAPNNFGSIYLAKLRLYRSLNRPGGRFVFKSPKGFHEWFLEARKNISAFHMAAFSNGRFDDLSDIVLDFSFSIEEALLKIDEMSYRQNKVLRKWQTSIGEFSRFFDENVWLPFALEISSVTVKGLREKEERLKSQERKTWKVADSKGQLASLSKNLAEEGLRLSHQDYLNRLKAFHEDKDIADAISEMERIYEKNREDK